MRGKQVKKARHLEQMAINSGVPVGEMVPKPGTHGTTYHWPEGTQRFIYKLAKKNLRKILKGEPFEIPVIHAQPSQTS